MPRIALAAVTLAVLLAAGAGAWLAASYSAMPVSATGFAYGIGARVFLTSDDVHALWEGRTPQIVARRRQHSSSNKYVWQRGTLARPGNCLDPVQASDKPPRSPKLCAEQDALTKSEDTLYVQVRGDNAIDIRTGTHSPGEGWRGLQGGLYEAEGKIGIGETYDGAAQFSLLLDADELNIADLDLPGDPNFPGDDDESCTKPAVHTLRSPVPLWLLPAVPARLCRIRDATGSKTLSLVHFTRTVAQTFRWSAHLSCRALLRDLVQDLVLAPAAGGFAGCLGGSWNGLDKTDLVLSLFEVTPSGDFALLK